mmetsp:Transcript_21813/g.70598  ORF Transcript_21813/g.70598 Transcript_21813/m.70598 type:complete len:239 (+) Transcript_21813:354-1070(+)
MQAHCNQVQVDMPSSKSDEMCKKFVEVMDKFTSGSAATAWVMAPRSLRVFSSSPSPSGCSSRSLTFCCRGLCCSSCCRSRCWCSSGRAIRSLVSRWAWRASGSPPRCPPSSRARTWHQSRLAVPCLHLQPWAGSTSRLRLWRPMGCPPSSCARRHQSPLAVLWLHLQLWAGSTSLKRLWRPMPHRSSTLRSCHALRQDLPSSWHGLRSRTTMSLRRGAKLLRPRLTTGCVLPRRCELS